MQYKRHLYVLIAHPYPLHQHKICKTGQFRKFTSSQIIAARFVIINLYFRYEIIIDDIIYNTANNPPQLKNIDHH